LTPNAEPRIQDKVLMNTALGGIALVLFAGSLGGTVLAPMKLVRTWKWDQAWGFYVCNAYFIFPWLVAFLTVPNLLAVYPAAGWKVVLPTAGFGLFWGLSLALYGVAFDIVGLTLTQGIILGASVALGSLLPLLFVPASRRAVGHSLEIAGADAIMLVGVLLCTAAGDLREKMQSHAVARPRDPRFRWGLAICILAGVMSTAFNLALVVGQPIARIAEQGGAKPFYASNAIWCLSVGTGAIPSIILSVHKISRAHAWGGFAEGRWLMNGSLCVFMGAMWIAGTVLYGSSVGILGTYGAVIGWPIYMSTMIIAGVFWGWVTKEWDHVSGMPVVLLLGGIAVQILAMVLLGRFQ
jgi:L-rhamnose-H+ transport protein